MSEVNLIQKIDEFCTSAYKADNKKVLAFWSRIGAQLGEAIFLDASLDKKSFLLFQLAAPEMYREIVEVVQGQPAEQRPKLFEDMRLVVNQLQENGRITQAQADVSRRVITQVEQDADRDAYHKERIRRESGCNSGGP